MFTATAGTKTFWVTFITTFSAPVAERVTCVERALLVLFFVQVNVILVFPVPEVTLGVSQSAFSVRVHVVFEVILMLAELLILPSMVAVVGVAERLYKFCAL